MLNLIVPAFLSLFVTGGLGKDFLLRTIPQDLAGFNELPTPYIRSVSEPFGDGRLLVTTGAGLGLSHDGGKTYDIKTMRAGLPANNVRKTATSADGVIYALTYGGSLQLSMSQDGGVSFQDITASLPNPNFPLGTYIQSFFAIGKRVFLLMTDLRAYYNTDSEGGPFVEINLATELGLDPNSNAAMMACATSDSDVVVGINKVNSNAPLLSFASVQLNGKHYSLAKITPADDQTAQYLQRSQNGFACFSRNGSPEIALTRLSSQLAFLALQDNKVTYTHTVQIPTNSNYGNQEIDPTLMTRAGLLFVMGYPTLMHYVVNANGTDAGFYSKQLYPQNPKSDKNQINDIQPAANGDWLAATASGWFRCDSDIDTCAEVIPTSKRFYESGVLDQNSQGFIFPNAFAMVDGNSSATHPLFYASDEGAWTLDRNFRNPIPFVYPQMANYSIYSAAARDNRLAVMTTRFPDGRVIFSENGLTTSTDLPVKSQYQYPMIRGMSERGEQVFVDIESQIYTAPFRGNFTLFNMGGLSSLDTFFVDGLTMLLSGGKGTNLALSTDGGKSFTMIAPEKLGLPAGKSVQLASYRGYTIAASGNELYQVSIAKLSSTRIFVDPNTEVLNIRGSTWAGLWLDSGNAGTANNKPKVITPDGNCYTLSASNGYAGDDDYMGFLAGGINSTLYFASLAGVFQLQPGFNKAPDCGVAQLP